MLTMFAVAAMTVRTPMDLALEPWEARPETLRAANRAQAADLGRKLQAVGCELRHLDRDAIRAWLGAT